MSRRRQTLLVLGAALAGAVAWFIFLPVPLGWAYRLASVFHRRSPNEVHVDLRSATFFWRAGQGSCLIRIRGAEVTAEGRGGIRLGEIALELPKGDLLGGRGTLARATVKGAAVSLNIAGLLPTTASGPPAEIRGVDLAALSRIIPGRTARTELAMDGMDLRIHLARGDAALHLPAAKATLARGENGHLRADLTLELGASPSPGALVLSADADPASGEVGFALKAPTFRSADLVTFPGRPWIRATVSAGFQGTANLAKGSLVQVSGRLHIEDAVLDLPGLRHPLEVPLVEFEGFVDPEKRLARVASGRVNIGAAALTISQMEAELGEHPVLRWQAALDGLEGPVVRDLLSEIPSLEAAVSLAYLDDIAAIHGTVGGEAHLTQAKSGAWEMSLVRAEAHLKAKLGAEDIGFQAEAAQGEAASPLRVALKLTPIRIGRWPSPWRAALGLAGLDGTANLQGEADFSPTGRFQRITLGFQAASTRIPPFRPGMPSVVFDSISATLESESPAAHWTMPALEGKVAGGPALRISDFSLNMAAKEVEAQGMVSLSGLKGSFLAAWMPSESLSALGRYRFPTRDFSLAEALQTGDLQLSLPIRVKARGSASAGLSALELGLEARSGRVAFGTDPVVLVPVDSLSLAVLFDATAAQCVIPKLELDSGGVRFSVSDATFAFTPILRSSGRLQAADVPLTTVEAIALSSRPGSLHPLVRAGRVAEGRLQWAGSYDSRRKIPLSIEVLKGGASVSGVAVTVPGKTEPVQIREARLSLDFPGAAVDILDARWGSIALPSARLSSSNVAVFHQPVTVTTHYAVRFLPGTLPTASSGLELAGTLEGDGSTEGVLGAGNWKTTLKADLRGVRLSSEGTPILLPGSIDAAFEAHGLAGLGSPPRLQFSVQGPPRPGPSLDLAGHADLEPGTLRPLGVDLERVALGGTSLRASLHQREGSTVVLKLDGARLDAGPWLRLAVGLFDREGAASEKAPAPGAPPATATAFEADIRCAEVAMAQGLVAHDVQVSGRFDPRGISEFKVDAVNDLGRRLNARVSGPPEARTVEFRVEDASQWARLVTSPWAGQGKPAGDLAQFISHLAKVPAILSGGDVSGEGTFTPNQLQHFAGKLELTHAVVIHPPRILNLLALKSRRALQASAEIERLTLDGIVADQKQLVIGHSELRGTSFVGKLRIDHASYGLADEQIHIDGSFFSVGFEVDGTRSDPQVYLQDNALIRAFGRPNEFDFGPPPKK